MNSPKTNVIEIFSSIQGEGLLSGVHTLFVRFSGCSIGCKWCDTSYSWDKPKNISMSCADLFNKLVSERFGSICFTGGEPLLQLSQIHWLCEKLEKHENSAIKTIETSGILRFCKGEPVFPDQRQLLDLASSNIFFSVSPKLKSAIGENYSEDYMLSLLYYWKKIIPNATDMQFKFVIGSSEDLQICKLIPIIKDYAVIFQLEASKVGDKDFIEEVYSAIKGTKIKISVQLHRILELP